MTELLRSFSKSLLTPFVAFLTKFGVSPNLVTVIGLIGHIICAWLIASSQIYIATILLLFFGLFDAVDGALARFQGKSSKIGAFLDSVSDRLSEAFIFLGFFFYFASKGPNSACLLAVIAALSAQLVSYTRARAESLGVVPKLGLMTRVERYLALIISMLAQKIEIGLIVISFLGMVTTGQRILFVYTALSREEKK